MPGRHARLVIAAVTVHAVAALSPVRAHAQELPASLEVARALGTPPANAPIPPPAAREVGPTPHRHGGWAAFGAESGFMLGTIATAAVIVAQLDDAPPAATGAGAGASGGDQAPVTAWAAVGLTLGGAVGGGLLLGTLASDHDWSPSVGWGLTGAWPGFIMGVALAGGVVTSFDARPALGTRLTALALGATAGVALGYLAWKHIGEEHRSPGWILLATWVGTFVCEVAGFAIASGLEGGVPDNSNVPLLMMGAGTIFGTGFGTLVFD